ncbi:hypothetical protein C0991_006624 [Blastosporella zonata]|nr:hypothetical protein C0991_006624 [Blastosporella zonata]
MALELFDLPPEIVLRIFCFLDLSSLAVIQRTNSRLHSLIQNSQGFQYRFAAVVAGVENGPHSNYAAHERLRLLKNREEGWFEMTCDFRQTAPIIMSPSGIYDLTGGIYFRGDSGRRTVNYCKLPSKDSDVSVWNQVRVDKMLVDIGVSVLEHDLIAILTFEPHPTVPRCHITEISLLELSTGKPHPLAKTPVLFISETKASQPSILIEIVGDHLVLVMSQHGPGFVPNDSLRVFEWKTGALKLNIVRHYRCYQEAIFISPMLILLPNYHLNTLDIWEIPTGTNLVPTDPFLSLALPGLIHGSLIAKISCRGEPNPTPSGAPHSRAPFRDNPEDAIVVFNVHIQSIHVSSYSLFVHRSALLQACTTHHPGDELVIPQNLPFASDVHRQPVQRMRAWDYWGPDIARVIDSTGFPWRWITTTAGQRAVFTYAVIDEEETVMAQYLILLDFNPATVRRVAQQTGRGFGEIEDHTITQEASEIDIDGIEDPVISKLAYVSIKASFDPAWGDDRFMGMLLDEERLLVLLVITISLDCLGRVTDFSFAG